MERNISLVSLLCFIIFNGCLVLEADAVKSQRSEKLKLIHRHSPELGHNPGTTLGPPKNSEERLKQLVQSDKARLHAIQRRLGVVGKADDRVEFPFRSARQIWGCLTWLKCKYPEEDYCAAPWAGGRFFFPNESSSFKSIPCSSQECKTIDKATTLPTCPYPNAPCYYGYSNGQKKGLEMTMGCTDCSDNPKRFQEIDGILALGLGPLSFAVKAAHEFGGKFSFCLENHWIIKKESSYLVFGSEDEVTGISVNGTMLDIPSYVWDMTDRGAGGMIVDSDERDLDYCFNAPPAGEFDETRVPRVALHFEGGAKLEPAIEGYIFDDSKGVKCLGFVRVSGPQMNILGNFLMQNHLWEFDLANKKMGFAPSKCILD
ncbi:hypothetical protein CXB51_027618 [Gossypium anomalum]|uniref:Peptidase A1 domain-containing protein n=1 Tax=Gossypium anomalum TaxID=47600 RepID=A0A8J5YHP4_9ROSI|nr:hypothetical protein CXB51_027618 [Gossypium anomalum]